MIKIELAATTGRKVKDIVSDIFDIHRQYIDDNLVGFRPPIAYASAVEDGNLILAIDDETDEIVGFIHFRPLKNKVVRRYMTAVRKNMWGKGIGSKLWDFNEAHSGTKLVTEVRIHNERMLGLMKSRGYRIADRVDRDNYSVYVLEKRLTANPSWYYDKENKKIVYEQRREVF